MKTTQEKLFMHFEGGDDDGRDTILVPESNNKALIGILLLVLITLCSYFCICLVLTTIGFSILKTTLYGFIVLIVLYVSAIIFSYADNVFVNYLKTNK